MQPRRGAAAVLGAFLFHGAVAGAAVGLAYGLVLIFVASFGENDPALRFLIDALVYALPVGVAFGLAIGVVSGAACGALYAGLTVAGGLPDRTNPRSWLLPLATGTLTLAIARSLLGLYFEAGDALFVWCPAALGGVAGAAAGHQMLPQGSGEGSR